MTEFSGTKATESFLSAVSDMADSVAAFNERFGRRRDTKEPLTPFLQQRLSVLSEEIGEFAKDINKGLTGASVLEACDALFVMLETMYLLGSVADTSMREVAAKNDNKTHTTHYYNQVTGKIARRE